MRKIFRKKSKQEVSPLISNPSKVFDIIPPAENPLVTSQKTEQKPKKSKSKKRLKWGSLIVVLAVIGLGIGLYIMSIQVAPKFTDNRAEEAAASEPKPEEDRIIVVSADINAKILEGGAEVLNEGAWHRFPERGNPELGGNFIVSGHRFVMTGTHRETMSRSRFYNFNYIKEGDPVIIHWKGKKYEYKVTKKYEVKPNQVEIEDPSEEAKLTIYTCTLGGTYDGREVVEAVPTFEQ